MEHLSSDMEHQDEQLQWRRAKVQELCSKGYSQREISQTSLCKSHCSTVSFILFVCSAMKEDVNVIISGNTMLEIGVRKDRLEHCFRE